MNDQTTHDPLTPDPRFVEALEWRLHSEWRKRSRASSTYPAPAVRFVAVLAISLLSALAGAACYGAAQQMTSGERRDVLVRLYASHLALAQSARVGSEASLHLAEEQAKNALISQSELGEMKLRFRRAETQARLAGLDLDEVRARGDRPHDDLWASNSGDRDFVAQRLAARLNQAGLERAQADGDLELKKRMHAQAVIPTSEVDISALRASLAAIDVEELEARTALRKQFVGGTKSVAETAQADAHLTAQDNVKRAELKLDNAKAQVGRLKALGAAGAASSQDLQDGASQLEAAQLELDAAKLELQLADNPMP